MLSEPRPPSPADVFDGPVVAKAGLIALIEESGGSMTLPRDAFKDATEHLATQQVIAEEDVSATGEPTVRLSLVPTTGTTSAAGHPTLRNRLRHGSPGSCVRAIKRVVGEDRLTPRLGRRS